MILIHKLQVPSYFHRIILWDIWTLKIRARKIFDNDQYVRLYLKILDYSEMIIILWSIFKSYDKSWATITNDEQ